MTHDPIGTETVPELDTGINLLETPKHRTVALHQLSLSHLRSGGSAVWFDTRGNADTRLLFEEQRPTPDIQVARAFTAYQHFKLIRTLPGNLPRDLDLVVLPCVTSLYCDNDVPDWRADRCVEAALTILSEVAELVDVPVLVSCLADSPYYDNVSREAARTISYERTGLGLRYETEGFETTVYWRDGFWQTTIPYWVDLLGAVGEARAEVALDEVGMVPGEV